MTFTYKAHLPEYKNHTWFVYPLRSNIYRYLDFQCHFLLYSTNDINSHHTRMVVGNLGENDKLKEESIHADEMPKQQQPLPAGNEIEANNTESVTLRVDSSHQPADMIVQGDKIAQGETMANNPAIFPEDNVPMTPLSNKSHLQYYSTRSRLSSASCPTGKCVVFS